MVTKAQPVTVADWERMLKDLTEQQERLQKRIDELESQQNQVDLSDAAGAVAALKEITGELNAAWRVLPELKKQIGQASAGLEAAKLAVLEQKLVAHRERESAANLKVAKAVLALVPVLDEAEGIQHEIQALGGTTHSEVPAYLFDAVRESVKQWRRIAPSDDELAEIESHFSGIRHLREKLKQPTTDYNLN